MRKDHFKTLILDAIAALPPNLKEALDNVAFVIEKKCAPCRQTRRASAKTKRFSVFMKAFRKQNAG